MPTVTISAKTHALLSAHSASGFLYPVRKNSDGQFLVDLDDDVAERLAAIDADPDRAIAMLCTTGVGNA